MSNNEKRILIKGIYVDLGVNTSVESMEIKAFDIYAEQQIKELEEALKQSLSYLNSFKPFWKEAEEMLNHQLEQALKK